MELGLHRGNLERSIQMLAMQLVHGEAINLHPSMRLEAIMFLASADSKIRGNPLPAKEPIAGQ